MLALLVAVGAGLLLAIAVGVIMVMVGHRNERQERLTRIRGQVSRAEVETSTVTMGVDGIPSDRVPLITSLLQGTEVWDNLQLEILRAGWLLRPSEFVAIIVGAAAVGFAGDWCVDRRRPVGRVEDAAAAAVQGLDGADPGCP